MDKTITLTSNEISRIAIYDKVMNLSQAVLICDTECTTENRELKGNRP